MIDFPFCDNSDTIINCKEDGIVDPICVVFSLGLMSLLLTIINIICILVFGWFVLWLKEVTPEKVPQAFKYFWKKDLLRQSTLNLHRCKSRWSPSWRKVFSSSLRK